MRIISGTHSGRRLSPPSKLPVRPTTDFAKTGLFNILHNSFDLTQISVLDLFSGTGNISFEFASRGALDIMAVDENHHCIRFITETSRELHLEKIKAERCEVFRFLNHCSGKYDIIFADPPYEMKNTDRIAELIFTNALLASGGWFVLEHSDRISFSGNPHFFDRRKYGDVNFSFFR